MYDLWLLSQILEVVDLRINALKPTPPHTQGVRDDNAGTTHQMLRRLRFKWPWVQRERDLRHAPVQVCSFGPQAGEGSSRKPNRSSTNEQIL